MLLCNSTKKHLSFNILCIAIIVFMCCFSTGCFDDSDNSDDGGTITVKYTGDSSNNGHQLFVKIIHIVGTESPDDAPVRAVGAATINNGTAEVTAKVSETDVNPPSNWEGTNTIWTGTSGVMYYVYIYIDGNDDGDIQSGEGDYAYDDIPVYHIMEGDDIIETLQEDYYQMM